MHLVRGEGIWLWDADGKKYLDCYNNVPSVGHCHPDVVTALTTQAATLNTHTRYLHENIVELSEKITAKMPGELNVCLFVCTGTEANDLATRMARSATGHEGMLVAEYTYHGDSTLVHTLSTADCNVRPDWLGVFEPPCQYRQPFEGENLLEGYLDSIHQAIDSLKTNNHQPAGIMIDSIFDCQGMIAAPRGYFKQAAEIVREAGGLLIMDEVQGGYCRTGKWWGFSHDDVVPDIVTLGKPMGGGHPIAAVVTSYEIAKKFAGNSTYFNTFGGNPVSSAAGNAVIDVIEKESILQSVASVGAYTLAGLEQLKEKHEAIGDVRGRGLFLGVELVRDRASKTPDKENARKVANMMKDEGVLVSTFGRYSNSIKIRPPLVFSQENADQLITALDTCLSGL